MSIHLHKLRDSRDLFPTGIHGIIDEVMFSTDEVHQFVRVIGAFEYMIKLLTASMHGVLGETNPGRSYALNWREHFIDKDPALGDWITSAEKHKRQVKHPLLDDVVGDIWKNRPSELESGSTSDAWKMCRFVSTSRTFITEVQKNKNFNLIRVFQLVVNLRNAFAHGSLTVRFAMRYGQPVVDALSEVAQILRLGEKWQFVIPLRLDPSNKNMAQVMDCDAFGFSGEACEPQRLEIGDRSLQWGKLYLIGRNAGTLDSAVILEPLLRFERSHRDYQFFNRYDRDDLTAEYLSYRSGDFDFDPAFIDWTADFVVAEADEIEEEEANQDVELVTSGGPASDENLIEKLVSITREGRTEKTLKRCRIRYHEILDEFDADVQREVIFALQAKCSENDDRGIHGVIGNVMRDFGYFDIAIDELKKASEEEPQNRFINQSLGHAYLQHGTAEKQAAKSKNDQNRLAVGRDLIESAKQPLKKSLYDSASNGEEIRHNVRSFSMLVDAHCRLGEFDEALHRCEEGLVLDPKNHRLLDQNEFLESVTSA